MTSWRQVWQRRDNLSTRATSPQIAVRAACSMGVPGRVLGRRAAVPDPPSVVHQRRRGSTRDPTQAFLNLQFADTTRARAATNSDRYNRSGGRVQAPPASPLTGASCSLWAGVGRVGWRKAAAVLSVNDGRMLTP
uniref:hypothetical protein n=1 Tax=Nonomuraea bangladeshensis TaxID=404385 RepID=UPI003F496FCF